MKRIESLTAGPLPAFPTMAQVMTHTIQQRRAEVAALPPDPVPAPKVPGRIGRPRKTPGFLGANRPEPTQL